SDESDARQYWRDSPWLTSTLKDRTSSPELGRELLCDSVGQGIRKHHHVHVTIIVRPDVGSPILLEPADDFAGRQVEMSLQHRFQRRPGPVGISATQERSDVLAVHRPLLLRAVQLYFVVRFGGFHNFGRDENVVPEERRELLARVLAVIRLYRVPDVVLVTEKALGHAVTVRKFAKRADDVVAGIGDV